MTDFFISEISFTFAPDFGFGIFLSKISKKRESGENPEQYPLL